MKFKTRYLIIIAFVAVLGLFTVQSAQATQETCPATGDWVKIEPIDAQSYLYTAPEGKVVVETCYKAATTVKYETIDPPQASLTVTTDVPNPNNNAFHDISHASFKLADEPKEEEEERPFVRVTYICQADLAGIVEGYNLEVEPGDHVWRIRHESGPATDFTTNFLSDVQGHIEVGETLFFVTPQSANGVKVITSPLENLYQGTASVSGNICEVPEEKEEQPFVRVTYICQADLAGIVDGYNLEVEPGDHVWRIRHESGPATDFTTNFLSDVQGHIEVGETLFFVTPQSANGVKVITSPLENLYQGTASVSGNICEVPEEQEKSDLSLVGICLGDGTIEWQLLNPNDFAIPFSWSTDDNQNGNGEVPANDIYVFKTTTSGSMINVSFTLDNEPVVIEESINICEDPKEETNPDPSVDVAAGGMGPSFVNSLAPLLAGVAGLGLTSIFVFKGKKEN